MLDKEIAELRRRLKPEKNSIRTIHGCYVNDQREVASEFTQSLALMPEDEAEALLSILRRSLSGAMGKNLTDIVFSTQQVVDSEEHRLLMSLRNSSLEDVEALQAFYKKVIESLSMEGGYLILLTQDTYDVPTRSGDGETLEDGSEEVFTYLLSAICPIKITKPALGYSAFENAFHSSSSDWIVAPPELGFLFPAFDDRRANLYSALYYSRNLAENHGEFIDAMFHTQAPMPAAVQKETFQELLSDTLAEECSYDVVHAVHEQFSTMMEEHKANKEPEPLVVDKGTVQRVLASCGVSEEGRERFTHQYNEQFGEDTALSPHNLTDAGQFQINMPDVSVRITSGRSDLVEARVIDGVKYLLIRMEDEVKVDGVNIHF